MQNIAIVPLITAETTDFNRQNAPNGLRVYEITAGRFYRIPFPEELEDDSAASAHP